MLLGLTTPAVIDAAANSGRGLSGIRSKRHHNKERIEAHMNRRAWWRDKVSKWRDRYYARKSSGGLIPDLHSRYFTADFPYGLAVIQQIGRIAGVEMPNIDSLIEWYDGIAIINDRLELADYGITDMETIRNFYSQ